MGVFTVMLAEGSGPFEHLLFGFHLGHEVRDPYLDAAIAADMQLIAAIDANDAKILDGGLSAIARTTRNGKFELVRHP